MNPLCPCGSPLKKPARKFCRRCARQRLKLQRRIISKRYYRRNCNAIAIANGLNIPIPQARHMLTVDHV